MNRRSFIAAVLTFLGLRPKPTVQAGPVSQVFPRHFVIVDGKSLDVWRKRTRRLL